MWSKDILKDEMSLMSKPWWLSPSAESDPGKQRRHNTQLPFKDTLHVQ